MMKKEFSNAARAAKAVPTTLTLRLSTQERARLEQDAAGLSLSAYARERLFGADVKPRRTRGKAPVKDHVALARVLRQLGGSTLYNGMHRLLLAQEEGRLGLDPMLENDLRSMSQSVDAMRHDLIRALGMQP